MIKIRHETRRRATQDGKMAAMCAHTAHISSNPKCHVLVVNTSQPHAQAQCTRTPSSKSSRRRRTKRKIEFENDKMCTNMRARKLIESQAIVRVLGVYLRISNVEMHGRFRFARRFRNEQKRYGINFFPSFFACCCCCCSVVLPTTS